MLRKVKVIIELDLDLTNEIRASEDVYSFVRGVLEQTPLKENELKTLKVTSYPIGP